MLHKVRPGYAKYGRKTKQKVTRVVGDFRTRNSQILLDNNISNALFRKKLSKSIEKSQKRRKYLLSRTQNWYKYDLNISVVKRLVHDFILTEETDWNYSAWSK